MKRTTSGLLAGLALLSLGATTASAQLEANLSSLTGDQAQGYLGPIATGLSAAMNSGIFRNGRVPVAGLNLTVDLEASRISFSDDDRVYATPEGGAFPSIDVPTVIGDTHAVPSDAPSGASFIYPGGFDLDAFGLAVPQLTIGNVAGTRAIVRYISLSLGDEDELGDFKLFGIGGQHSLNQYLTALPFDAAVGLMWQNFQIGSDIVDATATAFNVTGSKKFGMAVSVEPYVGLGLDSFTMTSEYTTTSTDETLKVEFDRQNDFHFTLGTGINFPGVKLHGELNVAAATGFAGGLSFGI
jgi:hypothetical protein